MTAGAGHSSGASAVVDPDVIALLILFGVLGALLIAVGSRLGRSAFLIGAVAPAATVAWVVLRLGAVLDGRTPSQHFALL